MAMNKNLVGILILIILILIATNLYMVYLNFDYQKKLQVAEDIVTKKQVNDDVINFMRSVIEKVLQAKQEVSFDDRLKLENSVRNLNDPEILNQWNNFVNSKTQDEAQNGLRDLLSIIARKIRP